MLVIGIAGGTGSGKTTVVKRILEKLPMQRVAYLSQDSYYFDQSHLPVEERRKLNFDHPNAIEWDLLSAHINSLRNHKTIQQPKYSFITCTRGTETVLVEPMPIVLVEGILVLTNTELRNCLDLKVFVDADADDRLIRVITRDVAERGRTANEVMARYKTTVKPMHLEFIEPSKRYADIIVPGGGENLVAIDLLVQYIKRNLGKLTSALSED